MPTLLSNQLEESVEQDRDLEKLRQIASLTENQGWIHVIAEFENTKIRRALRDIQDAQELDDKILNARTRKWLALREAIRVIKDFPTEVRKQLEESGDPIYGYRRFES